MATVVGTGWSDQDSGRPIPHISAVLNPPPYAPLGPQCYVRAIVMDTKVLGYSSGRR